jgi:hypothetical protein
MNKLAVLGLAVAALASPLTANASTHRAAAGRASRSPVTVANQFVTAANRGDYATVCRLYSRRYLKVSLAACRSFYRWGANIYGPFDYRIVRRFRLESGRWRIDLIRWKHPSFIELARERSGWRIVAGGW